MGSDRGVDVGGEDGRQDGIVIEEHRHEGQGWVQARGCAVGQREVVVRPYHGRGLARLGEVVGIGVVAVREAAFAGARVEGWV